MGENNTKGVLAILLMRDTDRSDEHNGRVFGVFEGLARCMSPMNVVSEGYRREDLVQLCKDGHRPRDYALAIQRLSDDIQSLYEIVATYYSESEALTAMGTIDGTLADPSFVDSGLGQQFVAHAVYVQNGKEEIVAAYDPKRNELVFLNIE